MEKKEKSKKFNIFLGDQLNKISNLPDTQKISRMLFSSKNVEFEKSDSLLKNVQLLLDNIIYEKQELIEKIISLFEKQKDINTSFYKSILDESFISSLIYLNYDNLFEENFSNLIKKHSPFSFNDNGSPQVPFYKILGDIKTYDECVLSTQGLKKIKILDFYNKFWTKLKSELEKHPTVLLGVDFNDSTILGILDYVFSKGNKKPKQIYLYSNKITENFLDKDEVKNFIKKFSIKIIEGENKEFLNVFKTNLFETNQKEEFFIAQEKENIVKEKTEEIIEEDKISKETIESENSEEISLKKEVLEKKLPIFEDNSLKKIILKEHPNFSQKKVKEQENIKTGEIKTIDIDILEDTFLETKTEIDFKTFFLKKFPIKFKNFSSNLKPINIRNLGPIDIDFGFDKQNAMSVRIIDYSSFRLIEMKRRDFKIAIGVDSNSAICLKGNLFYEYEIYRSSNNNRLEWILNFMTNLFDGCNIKFHSNNFICDLKFENYLEHSKFDTINKIFKDYKNLVKNLKLHKNKTFSELDNTFYQIYLLEKNLNKSSFNSWINAKIKLSIDNIVNKGDSLIIKRRQKYNLKNLSYDLIENISVIEPISKNEIKDGYLILRRKNAKVDLQEVEK